MLKIILWIIAAGILGCVLLVGAMFTDVMGISQGLVLAIVIIIAIVIGVIIGVCKGGN